MCVIPIVEGHGEDKAVPILLRRIWTELLGGDFIQVLRPIRGSRHKLVRKEELERRMTLASSKLTEACAPESPAMVLVLIDANSSLPCVLGPQLFSLAKECRPDVDVACVLANLEFETWFVASAESLRDFLDFPADAPSPLDPEQTRSGKGWIQKHFKGPKYSETLDQPRMTAKMDLALCRERSASFDKLCRELEARKQA